MFVLLLLSTFSLLSHQQLAKNPTEVAHVLLGQEIIKAVQTQQPLNEEAFELAHTLSTAYAKVRTMEDVRNLFENPILTFPCDKDFIIDKHSDIFKYFDKEAKPKDFAAMESFKIIDASFVDEEKTKIKFRLKEDGDQRTYDDWARKNKQGKYLIYGERCNKLE